MEFIYYFVSFLLATPVDEVATILAGMAASPAGARFRLGFVINRLHGGGAEKVVCTLANHYVSTGTADVRVLSLAGKHCFFPLDPAVKLDSVWDSADISGLKGFLKTRFAARAIRDWRQDNQLDGVISFLPRANFANILSYPLRGRDQEIVISQRNITTEIYPSSSLRGRIGRFTVRRLYNRADRVICNSPDTAMSLTVMGVKTPRPVIGNPQDLAGIRALARQSPSGVWKSSGRPRIVAVGRLIHQKGYDVLLQALAGLAEHSDFECQVLGQGDLLASLERQRDSLGLADRVHFAGWVENPYAAMAEADIYVLPSRWEGFGNVIVEAMALGMPIVAAHCIGSPGWLLQDGRCGRLCTPEDPRALAEALQEVTNARELRNRLGQAARQRAEDFAVDRIAGEFLAQFSRSEASVPERAP